MRLNRVQIIDNSKLINKLILTSLGTLGIVLTLTLAYIP